MTTYIEILQDARKIHKQIPDLDVEIISKCLKHSDGTYLFSLNYDTNHSLLYDNIFLNFIAEYSSNKNRNINLKIIEFSKDWFIVFLDNNYPLLFLKKCEITTDTSPIIKYVSSLFDEFYEIHNSNSKLYSYNIALEVTIAYFRENKDKYT